MVRKVFTLGATQPETRVVPSPSVNLALGQATHTSNRWPSSVRYSSCGHFTMGENTRNGITAGKLAYTYYMSISPV